MDLLKQYRGLRREIYVLFYGRIVTSMGALIWPMMTLILRNKLGFSAAAVAQVLMIMSLIQLPCTLLGGRLADRFSKRNLIVVCDLVTVAGYFLCAVLPISRGMVGLLFIAGVFAAMEWPAYHALVADCSSSAERESAYSLSYLGGNLGLVLAPTLGGLLFQDHLGLAFFISGATTLLSTLLILKFIAPNTRRSGGEAVSAYEEDAEELSTLAILRRQQALWLFLFCVGIAEAVYAQFNFLLPLNMEQLYGAQGAVYFGLLTSTNAGVVIVGTPLITNLFARVRDVSKLLIGEICIVSGMAAYALIQGRVPLYFAAIAVFTVGEVFFTLGIQPYLTRRIPATHRGRISSLSQIMGGVAAAVSQLGMGQLVDLFAMPVVWGVMAAVGLVSLTLYGLLRGSDRKIYPLLYGEKDTAEKTG